MKAVETPQRTANTTLRRRARWLIGLGAVVCALAWIGLALGIVAGAGRSAMMLLATFAAVSTEGLIWLTAAVLGVSAFQARREIWHRLRSRARRLLRRFD